MQKRLREQRRMLPQAAARSEHERYYDCATEPSKQQAPSLQLVRHNAAKCWEGYERVPGTKPYSEDSCRKKGSGKKKKKDKAAKKDGDKSSASSSSDDEDGKPKMKKKKTDKGSGS